MLFITLGDPHSISISILQRLLPPSPAYPVIVIGSAYHWQEQTHGRKKLPFSSLSSLAVKSLAAGLYFYNSGRSDCQQPTTALTVQQRGLLAIAALQCLRTITGETRYAILTCPIDKRACAAAGFAWRGQTEFFADLYGCATIMVLSSPQLCVGLVTNHLAIRELPAALTATLVRDKIKLFAHTLHTQLGYAHPRIAVCGFNPHCGDDGLCGDEDKRIIAPVIASFEHCDDFTVTGPHAADSIFNAACRDNYHGVLAIYHDQGLAPLKACAAYDAVNISGGLPILRIAPDHGPAADLYESKRADPRSFVRCFNVIDDYLS